MLKYLVILLDDAAVSFCHYPNPGRVPCPISAERLKAGIRFAMMENLTVQFVYPNYELPAEICALVETVDHTKIVPADYAGRAEVCVLDGWDSWAATVWKGDTVYVLRTSKDEFFTKYACLADVLPKVARLNIVLTDVDTFTEPDFKNYRAVLESLATVVESLYAEGVSPQLNLLTDRMMLDAMNNCNAGWESVTLAPDGRFYVCPAFYREGMSVGDLEHGLSIKNPQLYRLDHAPLCRRCDAYQCKRCVWLNRCTTYEVNTPSHEQCVMAHLERNASRALLESIRRRGTFLPGHEIKEIDYLDPFERKEEY